MRKTRLFATAALAAFIAAQAHAQGVVTIYSADGLRDGSPNWYQQEFDAFTKATGIRVQYIEGGSGVVVERVEKEKFNPQADVLVTLPPYIQKAAADGDLAPFRPAGAAEIPAAIKDPKGMYVALVNNYMNFIYDAAHLRRAPKTFADLLDTQFKNKIQYSTPGQAGDGTAVMLEVLHAFGGKDAGFAYLGKLQVNNLGPSPSTGRLTALVDKGELYVANGNLQMNISQMADNPNIQICFLAGPTGVPSTFALPYYIGLVKGAPHAENGRKLIDFLLTREAQSSVSPVAHGLPALSDMKPTDAGFQALQAKLKGVTIWSPDWAVVLKELPSDVARWHQVTGS